MSRVAMGIAIVGLGCGSSMAPAGEQDAGASDAGAVVLIDAGPDCSAWRLASVSIDSAYSLEALPVHPERSARIMVYALHCPGDIPAPPVVAPTLENEYLAIDMRVWRAASDCTSPDIVARPVTVRFPYMGAWKIVTANDTLTVDVDPAPAVSCDAVQGIRASARPGATPQAASAPVVPEPEAGETTNGPCELDCQCGAGEACLSGYGLVGPFSECARPCEFDRDCGGGGRCLQVEDGLSHICYAGDECADPSPACPDGFACNGGACESQFVLNGTTRHACTCDSDCDPFLHCAWQAGATAGRCEALCRTSSDNWCQGPHTCGPASVETGDAVCGWVGD